MKGLLREIVEAKEKEVAAKKRIVSLNELEAKATALAHNLRDFKAALESKKHPINLIAEIKKASPLSGLLCKDFNVKEIALLFGKHAQAISVVTEEKFFQGKPGFVETVKKNSRLPVLRKDFIIDSYQVFESAALGADAVLLIAAIVSKQKLQRLLQATKELGLSALVEVHSSDDFEKAFSHEVEIIGINNRNLETMKIEWQTFERIRPLVPNDMVVVAESGFASRQQVESLRGKADAVLVGSALMKALDIESKLVELGF